MSATGIFGQQLERGNESNRGSVRAAKATHQEATRRPSAGLDLMNLVQRVFLTQQPCRAVAFSGIEAGSRCAITCLDVARTLAGSASEDVLIVDADADHPGFPDAHGKASDRGLTTAMEASDAIRTHAAKMQEANLYLMQPGPRSGRPLLTGSLRNFLGRALKEFQFVLIHAPSLATSPDCVTLAQAADGMVLMLEASKTRKAVAIKTVHALESAGVTILGAVLTETAQPIPAFLYDRL